MYISAVQDDKALEEDSVFSTQREYLMRYQPSYGYFFDWLVSIYWELQGKCSPFEYAARVGMAESILSSTNLEHVLSSQKALLRIVRNLFPYEKLSGQLPPGLQVILGESQGKLRRPRFRALQDSAVKSPELVQQRYRVLARAFCGQAVNLLRILREVVDEEELQGNLAMSVEMQAQCKEDMAELKRLRAEYYLAYPEELLGSVADETLMMQLDLKRRSELPKDMEPEYMQKLMGKLEGVLRSKLQSVLIEAKKMREQILARRNVFLGELNELLTMCMAVRDYIGTASFDEINASSQELVDHINKRFDLTHYLPSDILRDLELDHKMLNAGNL